MVKVSNELRHHEAEDNSVIALDVKVRNAW